ncbi:MAG: class I SAM-dependent methyltransferase [Chloroflexaceae bacterium]|nr:class I SAM-dependent methyltransferase [Chloroflexaceae bacterium]
MTIDRATNQYSSSNLRKHTHSGRLHRWLLARFHAAVGSLLDRTDARQILDAGCGEGFAMQWLSQQPYPMVGLDYSLEALTLAERCNPTCRFTAGDLLGLPFADKQFDLVLCLEVLEHLEYPERGLAELGRVSRRWLLLSVPHEPFFRGANFLRGKNMAAWGNDPGHINHWSARQFRAFVASQYQIVACRLSFPWTIILCRND